MISSKMASFLRHLSFRIWLAVFLGGLVNLSVLPLIQYRIGLEWILLPVTAVLILIYVGTGWVLNRWAQGAVDHLVVEAGSYERDGMNLEAEDTFQRAAAVFDSFLISPFVKHKASGALGARMARFYLASGTRSQASEDFVVAYLHANPQDEEVAEQWLHQIESQGGLKEAHQELALQIGSSHPDNDYIQSTLARFYLLLERTDFPALQAYRRAIEGDEPLSDEFADELARFFLKEKRVDEWALEVYLQALEHGEDRAEYLKALAACASWIPATARNKHLLQAASQHLAGIDENTLNKMRAGFRPAVSPPPKLRPKTVSRIKPGEVLVSTLQTMYRYPGSFVRWIGNQIRLTIALIQSSRKARRALAGFVLACLSLAIGGLVVNTVGHLVTIEKIVDKNPEPAVEVTTDPFTLQVAAYLKHEHAKRFVQHLKQQGLDAYWTEAVRGEKRWFQVRLSHFASKKSARDYGQALKSKGIIDDYYVANYRRR
jgi:hypothetical protein